MLYYKMKYYNQNDLILVFGLIVISYFALRYLMTRKLLEGNIGDWGGCVWSLERGEYVCGTGVQPVEERHAPPDLDYHVAERRSRRIPDFQRLGVNDES